MTDNAASSARRPSRTQDRTLKGATISIAVVSLGLSGVFTYQAASATTVNGVGATTTVAPTPQPVVSGDDDNESKPAGVSAPQAAPGGKPVAVSGGS
jgi:hypothetical protein